MYSWLYKCKNDFDLDLLLCAIERVPALNNKDALSNDPRTTAVHEALTQLAIGNWAVRVARSGQDDTLDQIIAQLNRLAEHLSVRHTLLIESEQRFEEFLELISGMAALDFSRKARVSENDSIIDAMALGINMLSEELASSVVSRTYVNNIIDSMLDALIVVGCQGTISSVNPAAIKLFGYPKEDLVEQSIAMLFVKPEAAGQLLETMSHAAESSSYETTCRSRDGRTFTAAFSVAVMNQPDGTPLGLVCTIRDMTERRQAEETIRAQAVALIELSTPLIPLSDQVVVMPLIGIVDSRRAQQVLETLLQGIVTSSARVAILDITGVPIVDTQVANALIHAAHAARLLGAQVMLTGIRPEVAQTLVGLGVDLSDIITRSTLQSGIAAVLKNR